MLYTYSVALSTSITDNNKDNQTVRKNRTFNSRLQVHGDLLELTENFVSLCFDLKTVYSVAIFKQKILIFNFFFCKIILFLTDFETSDLLCYNN
jgi:hypothetical protein